MKFPKDFYWGAATSAYQVEGGILNDWTPFFDAGKASDHYNRFREDFDIARSLGHNAHRFSIEWARIEPEEGKFNEKEIEHYREVIRALHERGLEPFVTLWHWTSPQWFTKKRGFEKKENIAHFLRYVEKVARDIGGIRFFITINEPMVYTSHAYLKGNWPPKKKSPLQLIKVIQNLASAHIAACKTIKKINKEAAIGIAKNNIYFEGRGINAPLAWLANWWWNRRFLKRIKKHQDFIGLNYYFHNRVKYLTSNKNENKEISDMGWEIYPEGTYHVLKELQKYQKPIYITENGIADAKDEKRAKFIKEHLKWVKRAIDEGVDIRGYFYWSLLDNFEWDSGFRPRFGLVEVDYKTMERKIRKSALEYKKIIEESK